MEIDIIDISRPVSESRQKHVKRKKKSSIKVMIIVPTVMLTVAFIIYLIASANNQTEAVVNQYSSLTAKTTDSKSEFDKKLEYLVINSDGTVSFTVGYRSEVQQQQMQESYGNGSVEGFSGTSITLSATGEEVKAKLQAAGYDKAEAMAMAYEIINPLLGSNAAIGLMANICAEGNYGVVEHAFSSSHLFGFRLPSGGTKIKTKEDIEYLLRWPTNNTETENVTNSKGETITYKNGTCGVDIVQWSGGRRIKYCENLMSLVSSDSDINTQTFQAAAVATMQDELQEGTDYYNKVVGIMSTRGGAEGSVEDWAEAFCDCYIKPSHKCSNGSMKNNGSACQTRRNTATQIASVLGGL